MTADMEAPGIDERSQNLSFLSVFSLFLLSVFRSLLRNLQACLYYKLEGFMQAKASREAKGKGPPERGAVRHLPINKKIYIYPQIDKLFYFFTPF